MIPHANNVINIENLRVFTLREVEEEAIMMCINKSMAKNRYGMGFQIREFNIECLPFGDKREFYKKDHIRGYILNNFVV